MILITLVLSVFSILRTPSFQELGGRLAAGFLSKQFNTEIYLDRLRITESLALQIHGLRIVDHKSRNMIDVSDLSVKIEYLSLNDHFIGLDRVSIDSGSLFLESYPGDSLINIAIFLQGFQPDSLIAEDTITAKPWGIHCHELMIDNFIFGLRSDPVDTISSGIDFNDLLLSGIYIDLKEITMTGDSVDAFIEHISCQEKSGLELLNFSGDVKVSSSGIRLKGGQVSTGQTSLDLDLDFLYDSYDKISDFLDSVRMQATIRSSLVTLSDVGYFAPEMFAMEDPVMISGKIEGPISDFVASDLLVKTGEFTEFKGSAGIKGLPDITSSTFNLDIKSLVTTPEDVAAFDLPLEKSNLDLPQQVNQLGFTSVWGSFNGSMNNFIVDLNVRSDAGDVAVTGKLAEDVAGGNLVFSGDITGNAMNLGSLFSVEDIGTVNFELEFDGMGSSVETLDMVVSGWIEDLEIKNYRYEKIIFGGNIAGKSFDGRMVVLDQNLGMEFNGLVDFNGASPEFDFQVDLEKAFLNELNLSDRSADANFSGQIKGDFKGTNADSFYGHIRFADVNYHENDIDYPLQNLELSRKRIPGQSDSTRLRSDYIDGDIAGSFLIKDLVRQLTVFLVGNDKDDAAWQEMSTNPQFVNFNFRLKDLSVLTELFAPGITISPDVKIDGTFDSHRHYLGIEGLIDNISVGGVNIRQVNIDGKTTLDEFKFNVSAQQVILQEHYDGTKISLDNIVIGLATTDSIFNLSVRWDNKSAEDPNNGMLDGFVKYNSIDDFEAGFYKAEANINGDRWHINDKNLFRVDSSGIGVKNFVIFKDKESFMVDGKLSKSPEDTLKLSFKDWALNNFNSFTENISVQLDGIINGTFGIFRNDNITNLFAAVYINDFTLNEVFFGDAEFKTRWRETDKSLGVDLNILSKGTMEQPYKILAVNGEYYPFDKKRNFDFDIAAQNLDISVIEPLLTSFSSHLAGFATGKLTLTGTNDKPLLLGNLKLQRAEMMVDYLNVTYSFSNEILFKEGLIQFNELKVYDPNSNTAMLNGGIKHKYFKDMSLDLTIEPVNFMAMDLNRYQNEVFYGTAYATGTVKLIGPFNNLAIVIDASTDKNTKVAIPINYSVDVSQNNFIVFTNVNDSLEQDHDVQVQVEGVTLDIAMNVTSDADIEIFLPGNLGNIRAKGNGKLRLGVDPNYYLTLSGSYVITSGLFVFSLEQLVSRRFDILEGSKISWTGDIYDAEVNIIARYRLRTDLSGLGITLIDPEAANQKVIVNTDIRMTGNLFNPDLTFGITFPNMQEQTRQAVYAVLDTNDKGLMNQQAISLLVLGSFSSTGSGGNPVNPAAIVSNTLSNMLSQISNDFSIGINYMPGDQVSSEQLEVALSTQLLDDRLIIDGNFDVTAANSSSQQTSSIVGDINVEYKLTPDGRFRVKAFNRSNDLSLFNDYAPYTQGVGIFYRKDFNNIHELFRKAGKEPKKKKTEK